MLRYASYQFEYVYKRIDKETNHAQKWHYSAKIKDMKPQKRITDAVVFEVAEVMELGKEGVLCRVVDDTGIINAFFDQFAEQIVVGKVFEMTGLRVRVVNNHIRLEMTKQTIISKLPSKMAFKDLENDLSIKFFVEKEAEVKKEEVEKTEKKIQPEKVETTKDIPKTEQTSQKIEKKEEKQEKKPREEVKTKKYILKEEKTEKPAQEKEKKQAEIKPHNRREQKEYRDYKKPAEDNDVSRRKKYVQKEGDKSMKREKDPVSNTQRVFLRNIDKNCERCVNLFAEVQLEKKIQHQKYFICVVADKSGALYVQFDKKTKLEDKAWYRLNQFRIYEDKVYGYVAAQQSTSTIELVDNVQEVADHRIYKS